MGVFLRLPGYDGRALWVDELWRIILIFDQNYFHRYFFSPDTGTAITSLTYAIFSQIIGLFRVEPYLLRLTSFIPSIVSIGLMFLLVYKIRKNWLLALLASLIVACNPDFIEYSNQFKPYMYEVMVHLICTYLWLSLIIAEHPSPSRRIFFFLSLLFGIFSAPNITFLLPSFGISLMMKEFIQRDKAGLKLYISMFTILSLVEFLMYRFFWSFGTSGGMLNYWEHGFMGSSDSHYLYFLIDGLFGIWSGAFNLLGYGLLFAKVILVFFFSSLIGVIYSLSRRFDSLIAITLIFYLVFWLTVIGLNLFELWPLGHLRPNMFLYVQCIVMGMLFTELQPKIWIKYYFVLFIAGFFTFQMVRFFHGRIDLATFSPPVEQTDLVVNDFLSSGKVGKELGQNCSTPNTLLIVNTFMDIAIRYYANLDLKYKLQVQADLINNPCIKIIVISEAYQDQKLVKLQIGKALSEYPTANIWVLYSHLQGKSEDILISTFDSQGISSQHQKFIGAGSFQFRRQK